MRTLGYGCNPTWPVSLEEKIKIQIGAHRGSTSCEYEDSHLYEGREAAEANPDDTFISDFLPVRKCLLFKPPGLWYFVMAALAN